MFGLTIPELYTTYVGGSGNERLPQQRLLKHVFNSGGDGQGGVLYGDDFRNFAQVTVTGITGGYYGYIEVDATVGSVKQNASDKYGSINLLTSTDAADGANHDTVLIGGGNTGSYILLDGTKKTVFDVGFRLSTAVTDGLRSVFCGLIQEGTAAANGVINDSSGHIMADKNVIGWNVLEGDGDSLGLTYKADGQTVQRPTGLLTTAAAATWYRRGFVLDPLAPASKRISVYHDNVEQGTYVTETQLEAATFPDDDYLALAMAIKADDDAAAQDFDVGYIYVWQEL